MSLKRPILKTRNSRRGEAKGEIDMPFLMVYDLYLRNHGDSWSKAQPRRGKSHSQVIAHGV